MNVWPTSDSCLPWGASTTLFVGMNGREGKARLYEVEGNSHFNYLSKQAHTLWTKTCPNGLARSLVWDMEDEGHQPLPPHCVLGSSGLVMTNWFWDRAVTPCWCWPLLHCDLLLQRLSHFTLRKFLVRELASVFASLFRVSHGCSLPSCWNNMKRNGMCNAGSLVALLLL